MAVVIGRDPGRRLAGADLRDEPGVRVAGDRAARRSSRSSAAAAGAPRGRRARPRRSTSPAAEAAAQASNNEEDGGRLRGALGPGDPRRHARRRRRGGPEPRRGRPRGRDARPAAPVASGRRASKIGTGGPGFGFGPGRRRRPPRAALEHRLQPRPDHRGIRPPARRPRGRAGRRLRAEPAHLRLATSPDPTPTKRFGSGQGDNRLYFLWQGRGRKASDVALLQKAGIDVGEGVDLQFYPQGVESSWRSSRSATGAGSPAEIRVTRFSVVPRGDGYGFEVSPRRPLR